MKHSRLPWVMRPAPPSRTPFGGRALIAATAASLLSCVGLQAHEGVVADRDELASQVALLEASNASFRAEQVELLESLEDEREAHARLEQEAGQLRRLRQSLSQNLNEREAELARQSE